MPKKLTIENCHKLAAKMGGRCLSERYMGAQSKYLWQCNMGHEFESFYYNVYSGKWCRECYNDSLRLDLDAVKFICVEKDVKILSGIDKYKNSKSKLKIECLKCAHIWYSCIDYLNKQNDCPNCYALKLSKQRRTNTKEVGRICLDNGCVLLNNNEYNTHEDKILVECVECKNVTYRKFVYLKRYGISCSSCYKLKNRLANSLRNRLNKAIKHNYKSGSAVGDLGCSIEELKQYLESKFQPGMTWDNWSIDGWHIDHIRPLASFDLYDRKQFLESCYYTNLQPMWAKENLRKGAKVDG